MAALGKALMTTACIAVLEHPAALNISTVYSVLPTGGATMVMV